MKTNKKQTTKDRYNKSTPSFIGSIPKSKTSTPKNKTSTPKSKTSTPKSKRSTPNEAGSTLIIPVIKIDEQLLLNDSLILSSPLLTLKDVLVMRTVFTEISNAHKVKQYIKNCVKMGSDAALYKNPNILTAFYDDGTSAEEDIQTAIDDHTLSPTKGNLGKIHSKVIDGKTWLHDYADKVETIANDDANRNTRFQASVNLLLSFLSSQKLNNSSKGNPEPPEIWAKSTGNGNADVKITNGKDYDPAQSTFILVERAAGAVIKIIKGQLSIEMANNGHLVFKTVGKKGKHTHFTGLKSGVEYAIYAYAQNGTHQLSGLSTVVYVRG